MVSVFFTDEGVTGFAAAKRQDTERFKAFFHAMLAEGVYLPPSAFEAWFVSAAHDAGAIERIADALPVAARAAAAVGGALGGGGWGGCCWGGRIGRWSGGWG